MRLDSEDELLLVSILVLKEELGRRLLTKPRKKYSIWVKRIVNKRKLYGDHHNLLHNMMLADRENSFWIKLSFVSFS